MIIMVNKDKKDEKSIVISVTKHIYVPKHEIVSKDEVAKVVKRANATIEQFPSILVSDPVVREINAKPGDLIKITRKSETAGVTEYYRFVVS